jgi:hypothetical protein
MKFPFCCVGFGNVGTKHGDRTGLYANLNNVPWLALQYPHRFHLSVPAGFERMRNSLQIWFNPFVILLAVSYLISKIVHDRRNNPITAFLPEFRPSRALPTSGHHGPAAPSFDCNILRTIRIFFAPLLQRPPQCFQHNTASFFGVFQPQSFVLNNIQPLFCKTEE